jgi:mono/diheme cytochrome c family protein
VEWTARGHAVGEDWGVREGRSGKRMVALDLVCGGCHGVERGVGDLGLGLGLGLIRLVVVLVLRDLTKIWSHRASVVGNLVPGLVFGGL